MASDDEDLRIEDDGKVWGFMLNGAFRRLPKPPLLMGNFGRPPFDVTLPTGEVRHIIEAPTQETGP